jgi:hypothetical protein
MVQDGLMPKQLRSGAVLQKVTISAEDHHDGGLFCLYLYEPVTD